MQIRIHVKHRKAAPPAAKERSDFEGATKDTVNARTECMERTKDVSAPTPQIRQRKHAKQCSDSLEKEETKEKELMRVVKEEASTKTFPGEGGRSVASRITRGSPRGRNHQTSTRPEAQEAQTARGRNSESTPRSVSESEDTAGALPIGPRSRAASRLSTDDDAGEERLVTKKVLRRFGAKRHGGVRATVEGKKAESWQDAGTEMAKVEEKDEEVQDKGSCAVEEGGETVAGDVTKKEESESESGSENLAELPQASVVSSPLTARP
eukprot:1816233-Rhodomonas_salina.1